MLQPVIMAGGSGSRLWPLSRQLNPKQFLRLTDPRLSMLQATITRLDGLETDQPLVICNEEHRFLVAEQLRQLTLDQAEIILEPTGRNTAPAVALAALHLSASGEDPLMLVLAADHLIANNEAFRHSIEKAIPLATSGKLVTFGIAPTHAETGYGYIQRGSAAGNDAHAISRFVEKPDAETAKHYLDSGEYLWNSGMFLFRASRYLEELGQHRPEILAACQKAISNRVSDMSFVRVDAPAFELCPEDSIDYAVMENTSEGVMIELDAGWSDIGSWSSLWEADGRDSAGNSLNGDIIAIATQNSLIRAENRLVATLGVTDLVVVETKDAVLVAHKDHAQDVKKIVAELKANGRQEHTIHREVYRPWGVYDLIDKGPRYQVKRITVKPGAKLSVQMHHHRAEHWVVVSGTARVTNGDKTYLVTENQSTFIPIGQVHSLENPGVIDLELIEVQSGSYLGEDDITRIEDVYGRR
ncbi:mannose-1-phosphate guanylyltransferase/mannose-6-phosphate isomerase [Halopseudomonas sp.]|uniref:mannose-1-phosphate guanylyltransferase/mannose-6-phosphate isomerase n=1 Tax=Halopseudomonas sp. TaxID=2901191 RepID=UPI003569BB2B